MIDRGDSEDRRRQALRLLGSAVKAWDQAGMLGEVSVVGRSMVPTFPTRSRIWFVSLEDRPARRGEILLFRQGDTLVVHRVLVVLPDGSYRTKGDGRAAFDEGVVPREAAFGRVVAFLRGEHPVSTLGRGARSYARILVFYSETVGLMSRLAGGLDGLLGRFRPRRPVQFVRKVVAAVDRLIIRTMDLLLFPLFHRHWDPPRGSGSGAKESS
jgi:hypothetical protein